jgi:uncharacterized lipoprotein YehR (DUF1307 family)
MKKWLALVLLGAFMAAAIVGCGQKEEEKTEKEEEPA